jgi:hypothetical protein
MPKKKKEREREKEFIWFIPVVLLEIIYTE